MYGQLGTAMCLYVQLAQLEHKHSVLESENQSLRSRLEGPTPAEKSLSVSLSTVTYLTFVFGLFCIGLRFDEHLSRI